jgi:hypothetical protein
METPQLLQRDVCEIVGSLYLQLQAQERNLRTHYESVIADLHAQIEEKATLIKKLQSRAKGDEK